MREDDFYIFGKTLNLFYLYLLNYLKKTSHIEDLNSGPIQRCDLIHERLRLRPFDEKGFDLQVNDKMFASEILLP